jgi:hypothetical protein
MRLSLLGGNGFERSRRACFKFCQVGMAGLITSKWIFPDTNYQVLLLRLTTVSEKYAEFFL